MHQRFQIHENTADMEMSVHVQMPPSHPEYKMLMNRKARTTSLVRIRKHSKTQAAGWVGDTAGVRRRRVAF